MDLSVKDCFKFGATGISGLFTGCALYINAVEHPAGQTLDLQNCRKAWKESFLRAKRLQVNFFIDNINTGVAMRVRYY